MLTFLFLKHSNEQGSFQGIMLCQKQVFQKGGFLFFCFSVWAPKSVRISDSTTPAVVGPAPWHLEVIVRRTRPSWLSSRLSGVCPAHARVWWGEMCMTSSAVARGGRSGAPPRGEKGPQSTAESPLLSSPGAVKSCKGTSWRPSS